MPEQAFGLIGSRRNKPTDFAYIIFSHIGVRCKVAAHSVARLLQNAGINCGKSGNGRHVCVCGHVPHVKHCKRMASLYKYMGKLQSATTLIQKCE